MRLLRERDAERELRLEALRAAIDVGFSAMDAGDFVEVSEGDERSFVRSLGVV
ncbi:MAG: hypothetical protein QM607_12815 [Microbacterium sp.]